MKIKVHDQEQITDLLIEVKKGLEEALPQERKAFYPALFAGDSAGHEAQRANVNDIFKHIEQNGVNGLTQILSDLENSIQIGRTDFSSLLIGKIDKYFSDNLIRSGSPFEKFIEIKNDFLNSENRLEIKTKIEDLKNAKKIIDDYNVIFPNS